MTEKPCPACGFLVHDESAYGSYIICPLCGWEDCAIQLANPFEGGGPNRQCLIDCQREALKKWPIDIRESVYEGEKYIRPAEWRPLSDAEIAFFREKLERGVSFSMGSECYWIKSPLQGGAIEIAR